MGRGCSGAAEAGSGYVLARLGSRYPGGAWQRPPELAGVGWARLGDLGTWVAFVGSRSTARSMAPSWILSVASAPTHRHLWLPRNWPGCAPRAAACGL